LLNIFNILIFILYYFYKNYHEIEKLFSYLKIAFVLKNCLHIDKLLWYLKIVLKYKKSAKIKSKNLNTIIKIDRKYEKENKGL